MSSSQPGSLASREPAAARVDPSPPSTKQRLLDAAERLFAERGFDGTSMRAVTRAASTSVSAANYHFGSKEALLQAALLRRLEALDALEKAAGSGAVPVEALLEAFLRPGFDARRESEGGDPLFRSIAAQLYADPHEMVAALKVDLFGPVIARFTDALACALPDRPRDELALDFRFFVGVMVHVISGNALVGEGSEEPAGISDEQVLQRMVSFAAAGLRARCSAASSDRTRGGDR